MRVGKLSGAVGTVRRRRAGSRAGRVRAARARACAELDADPAARSPRRGARRRSRSSPSSLERFATEIRHLARTEVREVEEPFGQRPEGLVGDAAQAQPDRQPSGSAGSPASFAGTRSSGSRTSRSGTSATSPIRPPSASCCPTRSSPSTTCSTASVARRGPRRLTPSGCARTSRRAAACSSASGYCSRSSSRASAATRPTGSCSATRCAPGTRGSTSASSCAADSELAGRVDLDAVFDLAAYTRHVDVVFERLRALATRARSRACLRPPCTSAAGRCASCTTSTTSGCCSLPPTGSRPSTSSCRRRSPTRGACSPGCRRSGSLARRTSSRITCSALRADGRSLECRRLEMLPIEFVVRGYLAGSGWRDYHAAGETSAGIALPAGLLESDRLPQPIVTPATKATSGHDMNISEPEAAELVRRRSGTATPATPRSRCTRSRPRTPRSAGSSLADTKFELGIDEDGASSLGDEALTPDSSRFWPADGYAPGGAAALVRQAVRARLVRGDRLGQDRPGPELPAGRRGGHARPLRRSVRAADRHVLRRATSTTGGRAREVPCSIRPKAGILDPQGAAVERVAAQARFPVDDARVGRRRRPRTRHVDDPEARAPRSSGCARSCSPTR